MCNNDEAGGTIRLTTVIIMASMLVEGVIPDWPDSLTWKAQLTF